VNTGYRLLEHTADIRLLAYGPSFEAMLQAAGRGLLEIMGAHTTSTPRARLRPVVLKARDREGLVVAWLNELVYLAAVEGPPAGCGVSAVREEDGQHRLDGWVGPSCPDVRPGVEVKAATYHGLRVRTPEDRPASRIPPGTWWTEVVLDI